MKLIRVLILVLINLIKVAWAMLCVAAALLNLITSINFWRDLPKIHRVVMREIKKEENENKF
jgi:hypothetical protein